ncbi:LLM class flavin-dependent oxidoreductase [Streptomyces sp. NBC_01261]|uniref:LLM class flavin-dependent oxidoreductase n=1 Tax=Streptomyces sp. NBC_01261 TaxID=2903802 RepID=UPI002E33213F|nr:LLM class flavin-dependent oxidoreductase [Streptomyces sp. NBC_01261]
MDTIDVGVLIPTGTAQWDAADDPRDLIALGRTAEHLGFTSLFVNDSLISPRIEALTMLAALAPATERATLGTGALLPFLRRPVQAAQSLASIDLLSGGRLTLAVGAGYPGRFGRPFYDLSEVPWARRFARLDETVALWRALWNGADSFHGEFHHFTDLPPALRPYRPAGPPIWLGGATPTALTRTGRLYDGWFPYPPDPADYTTGLHDIHQAAAAAGRAPEAVTPALFVTVRIDGDDEDTAHAHRATDDYARATYGMPRTELEKIQAVVTGTAEQVGERLSRYVAAGARHLVTRLAALDLRGQREQLERTAALLPDLRARPRPRTGVRPGQWACAGNDTRDVRRAGE